MAIITFHSLEDRIVKTMFNEAIHPTKSIKGLVDMNHLEPEYSLLNKKPILASEEELNHNKRSHSAKLRVIEKL